MAIPIPVAAVLDADEDVVRLWFEGQEQQADFESGLRWVLRGGICWPRETVVGGDVVVQGYVVVAGMPLAGAHKRQVWVFECGAWYGVAPMVDGATLVDAGVAAWLGERWLRYRCRYYAWGQQDEGTAIMYRRQIRDKGEIAGPMRFIEVHWDNMADARAVVGGMIAAGRLWYGRDTQIARDWEMSLSVPGGGEPTPALHALYCLAVTMSRLREAQQEEP